MSDAPGNFLRIHHDPEPTAKRFHASSTFMRFLMGPRGTGKSNDCVLELLRMGFNQEPHNGVRTSRWIAVRATYPELKTTTVQAWERVIPGSIGTIRKDVPISTRLRRPYISPLTNQPDGTMIDMEVWFLACDRVQDIDKLRSLEASGYWFNELSEMCSSEWLAQAKLSAGRWPPADWGTGCTRKAIIADYNPPPDDHWLYTMAEITKPTTLEVFKQPPVLCWSDPQKKTGLVPNTGIYGYQRAEGVKYHKEGFKYFQDAAEGQRVEWVEVNIMGLYGNISTGRPVFPRYSGMKHYEPKGFDLMRGLPLYIGFDFWHNPSCVFAQLTPSSTLLIIDEIVTHNMRITEMAQTLLVPRLNTEYAEMKIIGWGDPTGKTKGQTDEKTCYDVLASYGLNIDTAATNEIIPRLNAVDNWLMRDGCFKVGPKAITIRKGFAGQYFFDRVPVMNEERYKDVPCKNIYSHPMDALQYICMGLNGVTPGRNGVNTSQNLEPEWNENALKAWY